MKNLKSYSEINESGLFEAFGKGPAGKSAVRSGVAVIKTEITESTSRPLALSMAGRSSRTPSPIATLEFTLTWVAPLIARKTMVKGTLKYPFFVFNRKVFSNKSIYRLTELKPHFPI